jgi:hypothetical protein
LDGITVAVVWSYFGGARSCVATLRQLTLPSIAGMTGTANSQPGLVPQPKHLGLAGKHSLGEKWRPEIPGQGAHPYEVEDHVQIPDRARR